MVPWFEVTSKYKSGKIKAEKGCKTVLNCIPMPGIWRDVLCNGKGVTLSGKEYSAIAAQSYLNRRVSCEKKHFIHKSTCQCIPSLNTGVRNIYGSNIHSVVWCLWALCCWVPAHWKEAVTVLLCFWHCTKSHMQTAPAQGAHVLTQTGPDSCKDSILHYRRETSSQNQLPSFLFHAIKTGVPCRKPLTDKQWWNGKGEDVACVRVYQRKRKAGDLETEKQPKGDL